MMVERFIFRPGVLGEEEKLFPPQVIGNESSGFQLIVQSISLLCRMKITLSSCSH